MSSRRDSSRDDFPWTEVVFLADRFVPSASNRPVHARRDLEKTDGQTLAEVLDAINALGLRALPIESPHDLINIATRLTNAVLLSTYGGETSRNRLLLPPAIAETIGIDYVGPDAIGHALAANKVEAKRLAAECGFLTPASRVLRDHASLDICDEFAAPYVLKPLAEGSSIGISQRNLVRDRREGRVIAAELLDRFEQPVLMESFVPGREASLSCIEAKPQMHAAFVEVLVDGAPTYFDDHLFDAEEKLNRSLPRSVQLIAEGLGAEDTQAAQKFLHAVGHFGYGRIDGKLHNSRFHFLEFTPDAWLSPRGQLAGGFIALGWTYVEVIGTILRSARLRPPGRSAND